MAEFSGFFDAHFVNGAWDRQYLAEHFAKYFASFVSNGVFGGKSSELIVRQAEVANMSVKVMEGLAFMNGYLYENDSELFLPIDTADGVLNRIDLVVLRWNGSERVIRLAIKKGTPAGNPSVPLLTRNADIYELKLAEVYIKAGATSITQDRITDTRLDTELCGFVTAAVQSIDTTEFGIQINGVIERLEEVARQNDVASLVLGMAELEKNRVFGYESSQYPGCFYRIVDGRTEWLNPPHEVGIEYCTYERWQNKPVYQKMFYVAKLPASSTTPLVVATGIPAGTVVSIESFAFDTNIKSFYPFPLMKGVSGASCVVSHIRELGDVLIYSSSGMSDCQAYITIKYIKN